MNHPIEHHKNLVWFLKQYFRYEVRGLEHLQTLNGEGSSYIIVCNHSTNLIDPLLFIHSHYDKFHIVPHPLGYSDFVLRNPVFSSITEQYGIISHKNFRKMKRIIHSRKPILAFPGEIDESVIRNFKTEPYTLKWKNKNGFLKFILNNQLPVVFVACIGADELVTQSNVVKMPSIMKKILGMAEDLYEEALQLWTVAVHPPIKITHIVTKPIYPSEYISTKRNRLRKEEIGFSLSKLEEICQKRLDELIISRHELEDDIDRFIMKFIDDTRKLGL